MPNSTGIIVDDFGTDPMIDDANMSIRFRICTSDLDREGDIIEPSGVDWSDYANNPTVLFNHGFGDISLPVGKSIDKDGVLHLSYDPEEDAIYSRTFFDERFELSRQTFFLVKEGFMRAASIHVMPLMGMMRELQHGGSHVYGSSMLEYSICTVGANQNAFAKTNPKGERFSELMALQLESADRILDTHKLGGDPINASLAKCLQAFRPKSKATSPGVTYVDEDEMDKKTLSKAEVDKLETLALAKALGDRVQYDDSTQKLLTARAKSLDGLPKMEDDDETMTKMSDDEIEPKEMGSENVDEPQAEPTSDLPPGAQYLAALHADAADFLSKLEAVSKYTEEPKVKELAGELASTVQETVAAIEGGSATIYADAPSLVGEAVEESAEMMKSWLADKGATGSYQLTGLARRLDIVLANPSSPKAKTMVENTRRDLLALEMAARNYKPKSVTNPETEAKIASLTKMVTQLQEAIQTQPAAL